MAKKLEKNILNIIIDSFYNLVLKANSEPKVIMEGQMILFEIKILQNICLLVFQIITEPVTRSGHHSCEMLVLEHR